jgi:hypothetical protein
LTREQTLPQESHAGKMQSDSCDNRSVNLVFTGTVALVAATKLQAQRFRALPTDDRYGSCIEDE